MFGQQYDPATRAYRLTAGQQTEAFGIQLGLTIVAAAISGTIGSLYGRRAGLFLAAVMSIIGPAIQVGVTTWSGILVGKAISGLGVGFAANFVIPYWAETTPASLRGSVIVWYQAILNVSQFLGQCVNQGTHNIPNAWSFRIPLLTQLVMPAVVLSLVCFIPDTPSELSLKITKVSCSFS